MKKSKQTLFAGFIALLFSNSVGANSLCQNSSCDIDLSFNDGGSIITTGYFTLRFGDGGSLNLGEGGKISLGQTGNLLGTTLEQLQTGGVVEPGVEMLIGSDGSIYFGTGARLILGAGGNIDYPIGDKVDIYGADIVDIGSSQAGEVVSLQSIDIAGIVNITADNKLYIGDFGEPAGINIYSATDPSDLNIQGWDLKITGSIMSTGNNSALNLLSAVAIELQDTAVQADGDITIQAESIAIQSGVVIATSGSATFTVNDPQGNALQSCTETGVESSSSGVVIGNGTPILETPTIRLCPPGNINGGGMILVPDPVTILIEEDTTTQADDESTDGGGGAILFLLFALGLASFPRPRIAMHTGQSG